MYHCFSSLAYLFRSLHSKYTRHRTWHRIIVARVGRIRRGTIRWAWEMGGHFGTGVCSVRVAASGIFLRHTVHLTIWTTILALTLSTRVLTETVRGHGWHVSIRLVAYVWFYFNPPVHNFTTWLSSVVHVCGARRRMESCITTSTFHVDIFVFLLTKNQLTL